MPDTVSDVVVVGAGIVGLATALALVRKETGLQVEVIDKEASPARHQSSHNSGVVHSGIYYAPGSQKAKLCREGRQRMIEFVEMHKIKHRVCGKLILASREEELPRLEELYRRGTQNGIPRLARLGPKEITEIEPEARGIAGVHVPETAIVDYAEVSEALVQELSAAGARVTLSCELGGGSETGRGWRLSTRRGDLSARYVVNCAGLESDRVARLLGARPPGKIVPFRGDYFRIGGEVPTKVRGLIYPVPDPNLPFLGVHVTPTIHRGVLAGPNALLAMSREGYRLLAVRPQDLWETLSFQGFPRFLAGNTRTALEELHKSISPARLAKELRAMVPAVRARDLSHAFAGVRAQFMDTKGKVVDDFILDHREGITHVLNAPSPAATASLAIGESIAGEALRRMG